MIFISIAHSSKDRGAYNSFANLNEYDVSAKASMACFDYLRQKNIPCLLYDVGHVDDIQYAKDKPEVINSIHSSVVIEIHCNSSTNKSANYSEVIHHKSSEIGKNVARFVSDSLWNGVKKFVGAQYINHGPRAENEKKLFFLERIKSPAIIVEGCFISNDGQAQWLLDGGSQLYGRFVGEGLEKWYTSRTTNI